MSAQSPLDTDLGSTSTEEVVSFSSATPEGQLATLQRELQRYADQFSENQTNATLLALPSDPLLSHQWHLLNSGQQVGNPDFQVIFGKPGEDVNVAPVWNQGITGEGVVVAVLDSGVEFTHPDLAANIDPNLQLDAITGDFDASPEELLIDLGNAHGTAVAGIIAAAANGVGGVGVAPNAHIVPIRLIATGQTPEAFVDAFRFATDSIDITNNSWGPAVVRGLAGPDDRQLLALRDSVIGTNAGRDGLGVIHIFASGNSGEESDTSSYNGWVNSRYTIAVTGVDHTGTYNNVDGTVTGYPEVGPSVLVAAPTGSVALDVGNDSGVGSGILTTDTTGDTGFNQDPDPDTGEEDALRDFLDDEAYTSRFNGTSGAAPSVSGVVALMLEANPNLSWRDVQEILLRSARQNAKFDTLANGLDKGNGVEYQSTWIVNQVPLFHDPDAYDPLIPNEDQILRPTLDPLLTELQFSGADNHYVPTPQVLTNGAGYTVSQGRGTNREQTGYAHGSIDAELAVQLAQQWTSKGQHLPDELSFTTQVNGPAANTIPAAEVGAGGLNLIIPGGLGGTPGFSGYWNEYFAPAPNFDPFEDIDIIRGRPDEFTVPSPNDMTVENFEVTLNIGGATAEALDHLRIVLVSPNGTHSELNHYFVDPSFGGNQHQGDAIALQQNGLNAVTSEADFFDPGSVDTGAGFNFTFSTNRIWGERSDEALIIDPTTKEPVLPLVQGGGGNVYNGADPRHGDFLTQGWQIHFENYGPTAFTLNSIETVWHGSPIGANTKRIQGLIGIDDNRDDLFNYSRVDQEIVDLDGDPTRQRLGEVQNIIDTTHESMGSNITVLAFRDINGNGTIDATDLLVDQFVTGADGNYYFDLVPDDYIIALDDDSLGGLAPLDDSLTPAGFLKDYQAQWAISSEFFQVWDYDSNLDVPLDPVTGAPTPLLDASNNTVEYHIRDINFLLDPGAPAAPEVVFNGQVIADLNGDGVFNGTDTVAPGILVYGDINRNDQFDSGEVFTSTDANGNYSLTVPSVSAAVINVGVLAPTDWTLSAPANGILEFFTEPGDTVNGANFALTPPASGTGVPGSSLPGTILGFVFEDNNEDMVRQESEGGIANVEVYIDNNNSGDLDAGDTVATTSASGAFIFTGVPVGTHELRVDLGPGSTLEQTIPVFGLPNVVTIVNGESTVSGVQFGFNNTAELDFGDLPEQYSTLFDSNIHTDLTGGARHTRGIFFLGSSVDAELNGQPSADALGDDNNNVNDEDGIIVDPLVAGAIGRVEAIASRHGGYLQAWVDFNGDGDFDDIIDGVSERIITNELLDPGANILNFAIPSTIDASTIYARFRYGEFGLGLTGRADIGEVEDYVLDKIEPATANGDGPDFNADGDVDGSDFLALQRGIGIQTNALLGNGDANNDGAVDSHDLSMWLAGYDGGPAPLAAVQGPDDSEDQPAAIVASIDDPEPLAGVYGSQFTEATTLSVRITQPGFREDLASVVIDADAGLTIDHAGLAATSSDTGPSVRRATAPAVRNAYVGTDGADTANANESLDRAFAIETELSEGTEFDAQPATAGDEEDVLAVVLTEDTDWLYG